MTISTFLDARRIVNYGITMADVELALLIDRFMRKIHMSLQAKAGEFDTENVGPAGGMVLLTIADMGRPEIHELTARFARDKSQMTRVISLLETKGLLERQPSERDRRAHTVRLTAKGKRVVDQIGQALGATITQLVAPLDPTEVAALKVMMQKATR
ncbi:MAG: MarR family transcriptional regulator [Pseudomonadota bacterium]